MEPAAPATPLLDVIQLIVLEALLAQTDAMISSLNTTDEEKEELRHDVASLETDSALQAAGRASTYGEVAPTGVVAVLDAIKSAGETLGASDVFADLGSGLDKLLSVNLAF